MILSWCQERAYVGVPPSVFSTVHYFMCFVLFLWIILVQDWIAAHNLSSGLYSAVLLLKYLILVFFLGYSLTDSLCN